MTKRGFNTELIKLGARIKQIRKFRKMRLLDLQVASGIDKTNLSKYENAKYPNVEFLTLFMLAEGLQVSVAQLTDYDGPLPNE